MPSYDPNGNEIGGGGLSGAVARVVALDSPSYTSYSPSTNTSYVMVQICGGGGGGGGGTGGGRGGGGGGSPTYTFFIPPPLQLSYPITIANFAPGGSPGANGANGFSSSMTCGAGSIVVGGGLGGGGASGLNIYGAGGSGGSLISNSTGFQLSTRVTGGDGSEGNLTAPALSGGAGGSSYFGPGAFGTFNASQSGSLGFGYGTGGSGASTNGDGGDGLYGVINIFEY
jgi:hypothetical protein